jgi:catechol 2,3-dioxygenase-like lactoylglutathione lyase family enzyme
MNETGEAPRWRGVNHLALVTPDMDATVRFWVGALGARLVGTVGTDAFRHYFFDLGPGTTIAFFEYRGVDLDTFAKPAGVPIPQAAQFDHLALDLPDEDSLLALRDRLKAANCEVTDVVDHGFLRSIYFNDPSGIALEASFWVIDPTGRPADYADGRLFSDADPVPAVAELRDSGAVARIPATRLVDEPTTVGDIYRPKV